MIAVISLKVGAPHLGVVAVITFFCKDKNEKFFSLQNDLKIVQPVSQIPFKGTWGCFPNKQFAKIDPEGKLRKRVNLYRFTLLANL